MKTNCDQRKQQYGLSHTRWGILRASLLVTFLVATLLIMAAKVTASAEQSGWVRQQLDQETGGYWQLVDVVVDAGSEEKIIDDSAYSTRAHCADSAEIVRSDVLCATFFNIHSEGSYTRSREWYQKEKCFDFAASLSLVATWDRPPERIIPGTPVTLNRDMSKSGNFHPSFDFSLGLSISTDVPHIGCGTGTREARDICYSTISQRDDTDRKEDCVLEVGPGSSEGDQFALRYCLGCSHGYRYIYQWVAADEQPVGPGPVEVEDPVPEPTKPGDNETGMVIDVPPSGDTGGGSLLGPLAVLGGLAGAAVMGVLAVLVGAVAAGVFGIKVLGGGGGAAAVSTSAGEPNIGVEVSDQVVADVDESFNEDLDLSDRPPAMTREQLENEMQKKIDQMVADGHYVGNTSGLRQLIVFHPHVKSVNWFLGRKDNWCQEMVLHGDKALKDILPEGSIIDTVTLGKNISSNHVANRAILPDGTELVFDFWEGLATKKPAIYTLEEWEKKWRDKLGNRFLGKEYNQVLLTSESQKTMIQHVLVHGKENVDEFTHYIETPKGMVSLRNWAKQLTEKDIRKRVNDILHHMSPDDRKSWLDRYGKYLNNLPGEA